MSYLQWKRFKPVSSFNRVVESNSCGPFSETRTKNWTVNTSYDKYLLEAVHVGTIFISAQFDTREEGWNWITELLISTTVFENAHRKYILNCK